LALLLVLRWVLQLVARSATLWGLQMEKRLGMPMAKQLEQPKVDE